MKEGGDFLYCGFPKLWEIFFNEKLTFKEKPMMVIKEVQEEVDWVDYTDAEAEDGRGEGVCHHQLGAK